MDVVNGKIGLSPLYSAETNEPLNTENIDYREVDPCHLQYLMAMGVKSSLVLPILHRDLKERSPKPQLWGFSLADITAALANK